MRHTVLFDLDGTLLPMDFPKFMELYFYYLGVHFHNKIDPKRLAKSVMSATNEMIMINNGLSNEEKFMSHFESLIDGDIEEYKAHFNLFYDTLFKHVQASTYQSEEVKKVVSLLKEKGYQLVIATNPLFPMKANLHRIQWAGLDPNDFSYISSFESNHYCKPHISYYEEVLKNIDTAPEDCYMIGNDVQDDLSVRSIGVKTYLITDCLLDHDITDYQTDFKGDYKAFYQFVKDLPIIKS